MVKNSIKGIEFSGIASGIKPQDGLRAPVSALGTESVAIRTSLAGFMERPQADQANRRKDSSF